MAGRIHPWWAAGFCALAMSAPAFAQNEQFIPRLVYRTGPYAPNGIPFADGYVDYVDMINTRDGGRGVYWDDPDGHNLEIITRPYGG